MGTILDYGTGNPVMRLLQREAMAKTLPFPTRSRPHTSPELEHDEQFYIEMFLVNRLADNDKDTLACDNRLRQRRDDLLISYCTKGITPGPNVAERVITDLEKRALEWAASVGDDKAKALLHKECQKQHA